MVITESKDRFEKEKNIKGKKQPDLVIIKWMTDK